MGPDLIKVIKVNVAPGRDGTDIDYALFDGVQQ